MEEILQQRSKNPYGLSDREVKVATFISNGYSRDKIAKMIPCSRTSVTTDMRNLMQLMECSDFHEIGPRWVREIELEVLRRQMHDVLVAIDSAEGLRSLRSHPFIDRLRRSLAANG